MNTIIILFAIILCIFFYQSKESFENNNNYYIDSNETKHVITKLPMTFKDILELKYTSNENGNLKFVTTKGGYNNISTENQLTNINGQQRFLQSLHLKNTTPFSGVLF